MKNLFLVLTLAAVLMLPSSASAQIPKILSMQGVLLDANNQPLADGMYNMTFRIYDAQSGGNMLFEEYFAVPVTKGNYLALIGEKNALNLAFDKPYWMSVTPDGGKEAPRMQLTTSPYAFKAVMTERADTASFATKAAHAVVADAAVPSGPAGGVLAGTYPNPTLGVGAVTTAAIADRAITREKIDPSALVLYGMASGDLTGEYPHPKIAVGAVKTDRISDLAVITDKLANGAVTSAKLADNSIAVNKIADNAITSNKISTPFIASRTVDNGGNSESVFWMNNTGSGHTLRVTGTGTGTSLSAEAGANGVAASFSGKVEALGLIDAKGSVAATGGMSIANTNGPSALAVTGGTTINTSGTGNTTAIGNPTNIVLIEGSNVLVNGTTNINTTGVESTNIGNASTNTTISGNLTINGKLSRSYAGSLIGGALPVAYGNISAQSTINLVGTSPNVTAVSYSAGVYTINIVGENFNLNDYSVVVSPYSSVPAGGGSPILAVVGSNGTSLTVSTWTFSGGTFSPSTAAFSFAIYKR
ncbi:MAG: hypothetical protein RJA11_1212 [Bacteroidota bacterium]|jgi:hypothetical protein